MIKLSRQSLYPDFNGEKPELRSMKAGFLGKPAFMLLSIAQL